MMLGNNLNKKFGVLDVKLRVDASTMLYAQGLITQRYSEGKCRTVPDPDDDGDNTFRYVVQEQDLAPRIQMEPGDILMMIFVSGVDFPLLTAIKKPGQPETKEEQQL